LVQNFAGRSRSYLLGRKGRDWNQGKDESDE
jgi:hypothetical protein